MKKVIKRNGEITEFERDKIIVAISKAMISGVGYVDNDVIQQIAEEIERIAADVGTLTISQIEDMVYYKLIECGETITAKAYEGYRAIQEHKRKKNTTDDSILGLLDQTNSEVMSENSNKNARIASTQRDLIAGEVSKDIARRKLVPAHLMQAHDEGSLHIHDLDYLMQPIFNCFSGDTRFVTDDGVKAFNQLFHEDKVNVLDKNGEWKEATVKKYGKGKLQTITLISGKSTKTVRASYNHRWVLRDGSVTTNIKEGDRLALLKETKHQHTTIPELFCVGFILGDGSDYNASNSEGVRVRLCDDKIQYADMFKQSGYLQSSYDYKNGDVSFSKKGYAFKQRFLDSKSWKILNKEQKQNIMDGYIAADGCVYRNIFFTADTRIVEMLTDISAVAGYHITRIKKHIMSANFKEDAVLYEISYRVNQNPQNNWIVKKIDRTDLHNYDLWCVEEPITKTFTLDGGVVTGNCCVLNLKDMLDNGTVINGKLVESPKSFQVACTVTTQIVAQVASNQYGGQSLGMIDTVLAPYAKKSYNKYYKKHYNRLKHIVDNDKSDAYIVAMAEKYADEDMRKEIKDGIQTIQYQINTLMTSNGQAPFLTMSLYFKPGDEYEYEAAIIQEEILKQRLAGIKNEAGIVSTPAFPKIIYFTDEHNIHEDSKYYYLTELAATCTAKRMYPDFISMKKMRENYEGNVITPMGCRAFLPPYKDEQGEYKVDGRFNLGVTTINLPQIALLSRGDKKLFYNILNERLDMSREMGMVRYNLLKNVTSDVSPIHWQYGAIARLEKGEKIGKLFKNKYATVTVGYIGMYETSMLMTGCSNTDPVGHEFTLEILQHMKDVLDSWYKDTNIYFALYGTPSESTAGRLCELDKRKFGSVTNITDKGYYINSFHVDVREEIDAFSKLSLEAPFQDISTGGCITYIEVPNMQHNTKAILEVIKFMYDNITYAEFNTKSDNCHVCGFEGEIIVGDDLVWECPQCHNTDTDRLTVVRRSCGYLGENFWSEGRTKDIKDRVLHL